MFDKKHVSLGIAPIGWGNDDSNLSEVIEPFSEELPFVFVHDVLFIIQNRDVCFALDAVALFAYVDPVGADCGQEIKLPLQEKIRSSCLKNMQTASGMFILKICVCL